jgi:hypothetical protein
VDGAGVGRVEATVTRKPIAIPATPINNRPDLKRSVICTYLVVDRIAVDVLHGLIRAVHGDRLTIRVSYSGGGLHVLPTRRHVAMPKGSTSAANGDPVTGVSAPLVAMV